MDFKISYENLKILLNALSGAPYRQVAPYIEMLYGLKEEGSEVTLKHKIDLEVALANQPKVE